MTLTPSAHVDTFCRDHLPPLEQWPDLEFTLPELTYPDRLNCAETLLADTIGALGADRPCLLPQDQAEPIWSYDDLVGAAGQIAHVLTDELGLVPGNRVLLRGPNNPWLIACWFGVLLAGGAVVVRGLRMVSFHSTGPATSGPAAGAPGNLNELASRRPREFPAVKTAADDVALIAFTSGTTG